MVGGVVAVVGAVAADVRGEEGVVVSTEQTGGVQWTLQCIVCWYVFYLSYTFLPLLFKIMVGITRG